MKLRHIGVLLLLLSTIPATADSLSTPRTVGIAPGDKAVFRYLIHTSYFNDTGNVTTNVLYNESIDVTSVNPTASLGIVNYTVTVSNKLDNGTVRTATNKNSTTIFDPYVNTTYLGNLGFPAFAYTGIPAGSARFNITLPVMYNGTRYYNASNPSRFSVHVVDWPRYTEVNITDTLGSNAYHPFGNFTEKFDAKTGVLVKFVGTTILSFVYRNVYYNLVSFTSSSDSSPLLGSTLLLYVVLGIGVAWVVVAIARRSPKKERQVAKMREKYRPAR